MEVLHHSGIIIPERFNRFSKRIEFDPMVEVICNDFFNAIGEIKIKQGDEHLAFLLANYLFERFTNYWILDLLDNGRDIVDIVGVLLWQKIMETIKKWEDSNTVDPDKTIPVLISKSMSYKGNRICKEVFVLLMLMRV